MKVFAHCRVMVRLCLKHVWRMIGRQLSPSFSHRVIWVHAVVRYILRICPHQFCKMYAESQNECVLNSQHCTSI